MFTLLLCQTNKKCHIVNLQPNNSVETIAAEYIHVYPYITKLTIYISSAKVIAKLLNRIAFLVVAKGPQREYIAGPLIG